VHLAHPLGVRGFRYRRVKNDVRDAADLADLLRMGRLPEAWIAPPQTRELRALVRYRATPCPHQLGEGMTGSRTNPALPQRICAITAWRRPTTTPSAAAPPASDDSMHQAGAASRFVLATLRALRLDPRSLPRAAYTEAESQQNHWSTTC
jgi:hypothetical protein